MALKACNKKELVDAMRLGEKTLEKMGVVSEKVMPLIREIEKFGGAAKILGGGGKKDGVGFLLCYHDNENIIEKCAKTYGFGVDKIQLGEEGIQLEQKS